MVADLILVRRMPRFVSFIIAAVVVAAVPRLSSASDSIELADGNALLRLCDAALNPHMSPSDLLDRMYLLGYTRRLSEFMGTILRPIDPTPFKKLSLMTLPDQNQDRKDSGLSFEPSPTT